MVLTEQLVDLGYLSGEGDFNANLVQEPLLDWVRQSF